LLSQPEDPYIPRVESVAALKGMPKDGRPVHLAIGMFDGVHLGHQALINGCVRSAQREGAVAAVLTFFPHPSRALKVENPTRLMQTPEQKAAVLEKMGVDRVINQPFDESISKIEASSFVEFLRRHIPKLKAIHVGENFRFGKGRQGDVNMLLGSGKKLGVQVFSLDRLNLDGEAISSTRVREALLEGKMELANALLGYSYCSDAYVVKGRRLGRQMGFPTLNLNWAPELPPKYGVYAVRVQEIGKTKEAPVKGVANYGQRPTVESGPIQPILEVHLLTEKTRLGQGSRFHVEWLHFLRAERKFSGIDGLKTQIERDVQAARDYFAAATRGSLAPSG